MWFTFLNLQPYYRLKCRYLSALPISVFSQGRMFERTRHKVEEFLYTPDFIIPRKAEFQVVSEPPTLKL